MPDSQSKLIVDGQVETPSEIAATPDHRPPERVSPHFDRVLHGYDQIMVDQYIQGLLKENAALRCAIGAAPATLGDLAGTPQPSPTRRRYEIDAPAEAGLGFGAEHLLRQAERETAEIRARATRHAEAVEAAARQSVQELRVARKQAEALRSRAAEEAARAKTEACQEAARVSDMYRSMKEELRRVANKLNAEIQRSNLSADTPTAVLSGPGATSSPPDRDTVGVSE